MTFNLNRTHFSKLINANLQYKQIGEEFCKYYYNQYDEDIKKLYETYHPQAKISFDNKEFLGPESFIKFIEQSGLYKFTHYDINITVQPVDDTCILITCNGHISINNSIFLNKFVESLLVQRNEINRFYICNNVIKFFE